MRYRAMSAQRLRQSPFYYVAGHRYVVLPAPAAIPSVVLPPGMEEFHGLRTSTGEPYDMFAMTAAQDAAVTLLCAGNQPVKRRSVWCALTIGDPSSPTDY